MPERPHPYQAAHEERLRRGIMPLNPEHLPKQIESKEECITVQGLGPEEYKQQLESMHGPELARAFETVLDVCERIKAAGGKALLVGGCVRDEILGIASQDLDLEVYGLPPEQIEKIISPLGKIDAVGKAFGIFILSNKGSAKVDVSLPRTDSIPSDDKEPDGFKKSDPSMSVKEAAKRRDFTFNAMAKDPLSGEIYDPFGGIQDLQQRKLRITDEERFADDSVRILRGAQFVGRFGLSVDEESKQIMHKLVPNLEKKPVERITKEVDKLLLKSSKPSIGLMMLSDLGVIQQLFPELAALQGTNQEFEWHPEGDVWVHTLMVVDAAAAVCRFHKLSEETSRTVMWSALCHDLGKPATTVVDEETNRIRSLGHEPAGEAPTRAFLERLKVPNQLVEKAVNIVKEHLWPGTVYRKQKRFEYLSTLFGPQTQADRTQEAVTDGAFRRLAKRLHPATIEELTFVAEADSLGRGPFIDPNNEDQFLLPEPYAAGEWVRKRAKEIGVYQEKPVSVISGKDLIALGFPQKRGGDLRIGVIQHFSDELRDLHNWSKEQILELFTKTIETNGGQKNLDDLLSALREVIGEEAWTAWEREQEERSRDAQARKGNNKKQP